MNALEEFQHLKIELKDIRLATANFNGLKVIGEGGFGKVYKALLSYSEGRSQVACKRLDPDRTYGQGDAEFWKEILLLSRYKHKNLISLLGFCNEEGERILVYELASDGSLDKHLGSTTLSWRQRFNICLTAAKGLCYLHDPNGTQQRVIHRDIKSYNILLFKELSTSLDESWHAKIGDLGLSKLGPANQSHSFAPTNVVGTEGYIDPTFENTATLTKESDVYSFGVVLFEVFCGRLCGDYTSGRFENLVPKWKLSCKEEKSDDIIFHELKHDIDPSSLKTFLDIAYRCLEESREKRPKMSEVVEELDIALRSQEIYDQGEPPIDYEEICKTAIPSLVYKSEEKLKMLLSEGVFLNGGKTWFLLNGDGEHCEMISSAGCLYAIDYVSSIYGKKSRFAVDYRSGAYFCSESKMHVRAEFLSPHITYTINLVFDFYDTRKDNLGIHYRLAGETKSFSSYLVDEIKDGWLTSELFQFTSHRRQLDLEITFQCKNELVVDGIEFRPLERVDHQVLESEEVDMPDTYWEQKLPSDYVDIIKWSKDNAQQATKKELYSILCKGFLINNGEEWFSVAKNGKKCLMLPASMALQEYEWRWRFSPDDSRFGEVAFDSHVSKFWISCKSKILSPQTTYGCYLVYKLQENHSGFERPLKVSDVVNSVHGTRPWYIFLLTPQTPNIRRKVNQNTHNPLNRPRRKGLPQQRNDAWMEVQIWEFQTGATTESISKDLLLTYSEKKLLKGLILEGIELKPI